MTTVGAPQLPLPKFDPRQIPIVAVDHELPAVPPADLTAAALRERFQRAPAWQPELRGDARAATSVRAPAAAAVLIPLVQHGDDLHVLLTRRTEHLKNHGGQISFPGGRAEPTDGGPVQTALREAQEEVGLLPERIEIIGSLPTYTTITSFVVTPVVGLLHPPLAVRPDANEVAEVFEVPLAFLMTPRHHRRHRIDLEQEQSRQFLSMLWQPADQDPQQVQDYFIWGATAAMLRNLYRFLRA
jgi:8-oxo-dGTP pyrophosphatase MutT (NUDIX family)